MTAAPGRFFFVDRGLWHRASCTNDLGKMTALLVMACGTGKDCRRTKWSTRAIETHTGQRKETSKAKIAEMIAEGMVEHVEADDTHEVGSTPMRPIYRLAPLEREGAIILPSQIITGFNGEPSMLRRVRDSRDPQLLRLFVELYAQADGDQPAFVSPAFLVGRRNLYGQDHPASPDDPPTDGEVARWRLFTPPWGSLVTTMTWPQWAYADGWEAAFARLERLRALGAVEPEPWLFNGDGPDADFITPLDADGDAVDLWPSIDRAVGLLTDHLRGDGLAHDGRWAGAIPVPYRFTQPTVLYLYRLRVEPSTGHRNAAYGRRMEMVKAWAEEMNAAARWLPGERSECVPIKGARHG